MKIIISTNSYQANRSHLFSGHETTSTLKADLTPKEAKKQLKSIAYNSSDNNIELENGDIYSNDFDDVIYAAGDKSFEDDGYLYQIVSNNF